MSRDFDMEKVIDKMRELKEKRDLEILNQDLQEADINSDGNKEITKNQVLNVKYLGTIYIDGKEKEIYLLSEQKQQPDGTLAEIEKYYTEDGEFLAGHNKSDQFDFLLLNEKYAEQEELLKNLQALDKEGILDLNELEQDRLEEIAKTIGLDVKDLDKISEIDPNKEIDLKKEKTSEKESGSEKEEDEVLSKEEVEKISSKTEIKTNQKVTDKETMASLLNIEDKNYVKIDIIYSEKMENSGSNSRFAIVGIKEDGSAEKIETLEQAYGTNPTKDIQTLNRDGSKVEQKQVNSIFKIKGEKETQIAVDIGEMGIIEPTLVRTPAQDNEEAISVPIETENIRPTTREVRELMNTQRNPRVKEEIQKAEEHEELGCDDITIKDINDNPNDVTHEHIELDSEYLDKCASKILENDEIASVYNRADVIEYLEEYTKDSDKIPSTDELIQKVEEEMEQKAAEEHELPQKNR